MYLFQCLKDVSRPYRHFIRKIRLWLVSQFLILRIGIRWKTRYLNPLNDLPGELVVSLTSFPARFPFLPLTLRCLFTQSIRPNRIVLWISDADRSKLPVEIREFTKLGLEIRFCQDIRSYKKIVPSLQAFPNAFIVTADDDIYYRVDWLEELVHAYSGDDTCVLCHRAHCIVLNETGLPAPYREWVMEKEQTDVSPLVFPTSGAGVLYPPGVFHRDIINTDSFLSLCPTADDVWLYWMMRIQGSMARTIGSYRTLFSWYGSQEVALWQVNYIEGGNDTQVEAMQAAYPLVFSTNNN